MQSLKDLIGCRCHGTYQYGSRAIANNNSKTPAHTFSWAQSQYLEERPVVPTHQFLNLSLDIEKEELHGSNTIQIRAVQAEVTSFKIDCIDLIIHDVRLSGQPAKFTSTGSAIEIICPTPLKRSNSAALEITFTCKKPKAGLYFIKPDEKYPKRPVQVWTQGQDDDAKYWFPCFDEPRLKSTFEMKIDVPAGFIATSNGALHSESRSGKSWTFHWKSAFTIPSYLVTLTVGQFGEIKEDWRGKPVNFLFEKGQEAQAKLSFGKTTKMMDLFSQLLGVDYPYEKYTQIAVAEFVFGGMENTSATTQTDLTFHPMDVEEDYSSDDLVSHELAHQWFGDYVTCKSWVHGWLNEGWATYMEQVFKEVDLGKEETQYYRYGEFKIYQDEDGRLYRRPLVTNFYSDPGEIWDRHLYQKGGLIIHMLRKELGEDDFWSGTKLYLNTFKGGVAETIDFQRCLEQASGRSLQKFFDQWVYKGGYPELKAGLSWNEKSKAAEFKLEQTQKLNELTPLFELSSQIVFYFADKTSQSFSVNLDQDKQTYVFALKEKPVYCTFDEGNHIAKTLDWNLPLEMVKNQLQAESDCVGKVWAMKSLVKEATREGVEAIIQRLKTDPVWGVRAEAAECLGEVKTFGALNALVSALKEEKKSKVRSAICGALGRFKEKVSADALLEILQTDPSVVTRGAAAAALGETKDERAFDALTKALNTDVWHDVVPARAFAGLRKLRDDRALPYFLKGAAYGAKKGARATAAAALAEYGLDKKEVTSFLSDLLEDPSRSVMFAATDALAKRFDPSVASTIEDQGHKMVDGHYKALAFRAVRKLKESLRKPAELQALDESVGKLKDENRKLKERLEKLEQSLGTGSRP